METNNQTKTNKSKVFSAFGTPDKVSVNGTEMTDKIVEDFGNIEEWLQLLATVCNEGRVAAFTLSRINGVVKLYVKSTD